MKEFGCELGRKEKEKEGLRAACDLLRAKCKEKDQHFRFSKFQSFYPKKLQNMHDCFKLIIFFREVGFSSKSS